ncbi:MAG TPA: SIMPL domain-containing protein [Gaiellaceae bacterium]|nr:SIMPL domain-containing protein [Gaiellaceae bacterium]
MRDRLPLLIGLTLLAVAIAVGSLAIAGGIRDRNRNDVITVTGSAKKRISSDYVVWDFAVTSQQASPTAAARELADWTTRIRAFLATEGVQAAELSVQPISTESVTAQSGASKVLGYRLTRSFEIRSQRVAEIGLVAEHGSSLLAVGIPLTAQPLQYVYTQLPSLRPSLLAEATRDAQQRARVLTGATGAHLGKLRAVNVGVFQVTSPNSTQVSDLGTYDTTTLQKDVTAVVNVTFALG